MKAAAFPISIDAQGFEDLGDHLEAALRRMNTLGRIPVCGFISGYNSGHSPVSNLSNIIYSRVMLRGFVAPDFMHLYGDFQRDMAGWLKDGRVKYQETIVKVLTALKSGEPPQMSVLLSTDMFTLIDEDAIVPFDDLATSAEDRSWLKSFFPAFMLNSQTGGKTWGIPFQRSTIVLYWNKEAFKEAGLDPSRPPATWAEQIDYAKKLTKRDASGNVTQWGLKVPSSGFPYWLFQGFTTQNDVLLMNPAGTETYYDRPAVIEALQYWVDLSQKHKVMPTGIIEWGTTPKDFFERQTAMMWTTTGNLTNVKNNAKFEFGVAMLPAGKRRGSPTGGGNFHVFKKSTPAQQAASLKFIKWITSPARAAQWGIDTGYVAVRVLAGGTHAWVEVLVPQGDHAVAMPFDPCHGVPASARASANSLTFARLGSASRGSVDCEVTTRRSERSVK